MVFTRWHTFEMKQLTLFLSIFIILTSCSATYSNQENQTVSSVTSINPTGTYDLESKTEKKGDDIYGYTGQIQVRQLNEHKIMMTFVVNKGAPSYNSGSFVDTLDYQNNSSIYTVPDLDPSCKITFQFTESGVSVKEETDNYNSGCGFGHAVVADGFFKKNSTEEPELRHPMTGEIIEGD